MVHYVTSLVPQDVVEDHVIQLMGYVVVLEIYRSKFDICSRRRYVELCQQSCSQGCSGGPCNKTDGTCSCLSNFTGAKCHICEPGRFGTLCEQTCSLGCSGESCNNTDGTCSCLGNFTGANATVVHNEGMMHYANSLIPQDVFWDHVIQLNEDVVVLET
ncbi:hypothetical protein DPMN_152629 [Dreissena polymorpha]|uniref:Uncharacterized protein n=1 Tax=Dreissena polymorpha TaxID=45954 RepID=A0A9D4J5C2_DREPO|nr:hypothetical protein DPMN_152629 [Dreissena polymorpha]